MHRLNILACFLPVFGSILLNAVAAEQPRIQLSVDSDEVILGETITLQVIVYDVESPDVPDVSHLENDFQVELQGTQPMSSSSIVIINGRMTSQQELKTLFQFQLVPKRAGDLPIGPIKVNIGNEEIFSESKLIRVIQPEPQEFVLAELQSIPQRVYSTQSVDVILRVLVRSLPDSQRDPLQPLRRNPPSLSIPWIESHDGLKGPGDVSHWLSRLKSDRGYGFSINNYRSSDPFDFGFGRPSLALFDLESGVVERELPDGTSKRYFQYEFKMTFQPERAGRFVFGPAAVKGTFVVGADGDDYRGQKTIVTVDPIVVDVKEVPEHRPQQFMGGIGRFRAEASISPAKARVGDPMTLTLRFAGPSVDSTSLVAAPDLRLVEPIANDFEVLDFAPVGRTDGDSKTFSYGIRPKNSLNEFPALTFFSFDPDSEEFLPLQTSAFPVEVIAGARVSAIEIVGSEDRPRNELAASDSGVFYGSAELYPLTDDSISVSRWAGAAGLSWVLAIAFTGFVKIRSRSEGLSSARRLEEAKVAARANVNAARHQLRQGSFVAAGNHLRQAILGLVSAGSGEPSKGLTSHDVIDRLRNDSYDPSLVEQLKSILENIDAANYGGAKQTDLEVDLQQVEAMLERLSRRPTSSSSRFPKNLTKNAMVGWSFFCLVQSSNSAMAQSQDWQDRFERSVSAMETAQSPAEFAEVAKSLESLEKDGARSGSLYFHAGNAWYRAGQMGRAIRLYREAKFYLPRDAYLQSNLEQVLKMAPGRSTIQPGTTLLGRILFWSGWLSYSEKIRIASVVMILSAMTVPISAFLRDRRWLIGTLVLALASVGIGLDASIHSPQNYIANYGVITSETTARKGLGEEYGPAFDRPLLDGAEFEVIQRTSKWTLARFAGVGDGWISNEAIAD